MDITKLYGLVNSTVDVVEEIIMKQINLRLSSFWVAMFFITFHPIFWTMMGRLEYNTQFLTRICHGNKYLACYILAALIFALGFYRDMKYFFVKLFFY